MKSVFMLVIQTAFRSTKFDCLVLCFIFVSILSYPFLTVSISQSLGICIAANRLSIICRAAAVTEGSSADAAQPEMCQQWSLVSIKHASVNLGFSFWIAQQDRTAKYSTADLIFFQVLLV